jgi:hypothetical protein
MESLIQQKNIGVSTIFHAYYSIILSVRTYETRISMQTSDTTRSLARRHIIILKSVIKCRCRVGVLYRGMLNPKSICAL